MKFFKVALAAFLLGFSTPAFVNAREVNSTPSSPDAFSVHGGGTSCYSGGFVAGCEVAVDVNGNFLPTVTNAQTLGTSSLAWSNIYSVSRTNSGSEATGTIGATNSTGQGGTAATSDTITGLLIFGKVAITGIVASTTIPVNSSFETLMSTANTTVNITATPSIATTTVVGGSTGLTSGTFLILSSTGTSGVIFTDEGTLTGTRLQLGAATRTVTQYKVLTLIFDAVNSMWIEKSFGNN